MIENTTSLLAGISAFTGGVMSFAALLIIRFRTDEDNGTKHSAAYLLPIVGFLVCVLDKVSWRRDRRAIICLLAGAILLIGGLWTLAGK